MPRSSLSPRNPPSPQARGKHAPRCAPWRRLRLAWLLLASLLLAVGPQQPVAAEGTVLRVDPQQLAIGQGDLADLRILVDNVTNLYAADIRLTFDPNILEVVDLDESQGGLQVKPGEYPYPDNILRNIADNTDGTVWYAVTQLTRAPLTGSGTICTVRLRAKALGTSPIEILTDMAGLANNDGLLIDALVQAGQITVVAKGSAIVPPVPPTRPGTPAMLTPTMTAAATPPAATDPAAPTATFGAPGYPEPTANSAQPVPTINNAPVSTALPAEGYPLPGEVASPLPTEAVTGLAPTLAATSAAVTGAAATATAEAAAIAEITALAEIATVTPVATAATAATVPPAAPPPVTPLIPRGLFQFLMGALAVGTVALFVYLWRGKGQ